MQESLMVIHNPAKFRDRNHSGSKDVMFCTFSLESRLLLLICNAHGIEVHGMSN